ncbi:MAG: glycosyltransferase family 2 protein [Bacteroidota bacterium]
MKTPFFSIIMPTYNRAAFLAVAIESVLTQTFENWELVVVDDGSADNTKEVVLSFNNSKIKYLFQSNSERCAARNNGINHSEGQYICFLDSDDYYLQNHLKSLYQAIESSDFPEAVFITDVVREEKGKLTKVAHEPIENYLNNVCYILCVRESVIPARVCIHSNIVKKFQFASDITISEDAELLTRIGAKYPFIQVPQHTVVYHLHEENSTNRFKNPYASQLVALKMIFSNPSLKSFISLKIKNEKLSKCYYGIAQYYQYKKQYARMIWTLIKSIALYPGAESTKAKVYLILTGWRG